VVLVSVRGRERRRSVDLPNRPMMVPAREETEGPLAEVTVPLLSLLLRHWHPVKRVVKRHERVAMALRADAIVERVRLHLAIERPHAVVVSTALAPFDPEVAQRWHSGGTVRPASTPSTGASHHAAIHVTLRLQSRDAAPHELAGWGELECGDGASSSEPEDEGDVTLLLADGDRLLVSRRLLRRHSCMLATLLSSPGWHESATSEISLPTHDAAVVRGAVAWMAAAGGPPKRQAAAALLTPELVVEAARFCHYAGLHPLLDAATRLLRSALDAHNAPSVLLLARELELATLEAEACGMIFVATPYPYPYPYP
jgi:hypothetical protein